MTLRKTIRKMGFSSRVQNKLARINVQTLGDLLQRTEWELLSIRGFGLVCLNDVKTALQKIGEQLKNPMTQYEANPEWQNTIQTIKRVKAGENAVILQGALLLAARMARTLHTLTYREREIIKLRFGLIDGKSLAREEIAVMFKVTSDRVRQVEEKALRKLQHPVRISRLFGAVE